VTTNYATLKANVATLVADGASPTQAHVNTLAATLTSFETDVGTMFSTLLVHLQNAQAASGGVQENLAVDLLAVQALIT